MTATDTALQGRPVVVISSSRDTVNLRPVQDALQACATPVITVLTDKILDGSQRFAVEMSDGQIRFTCDGTSFFPEDVVGAWWRKPQWTELKRSDPVAELSIGLELEQAHLALATLLSEPIWLNSPDAIRRAQPKLRQLQLAAAIGFSVPDTVMGNDWQTVQELASRENVVYKTLRGGLMTSDENRVVFTTPLDGDGVGALSQAASPWPGVFQARVEGIREWRVTVVDGHVFAAAIYPTAAPVVDWRKHQLNGRIRFAADQLTPDTAKRCARLCDELALRYAAIDLIETQDGLIHFLEINPNGQYGWLEAELGLPISKHIATALTSGAGHAEPRVSGPIP